MLSTNNGFIWQWSLCSSEQYIRPMFFSPLGKPAERAIYFTFRNFFFFYSEQSYLSIYWTDFHDLFTKWKVFAWIFLIGSIFPIPQGTLTWQPILCRKQNTNHVQFLQFLHRMKAFWVQMMDLKFFFQYLKGRCHDNQFCFVPDSFARSRSISGSAGPIFTIFAPYGRYWMADDQSDLLFPIS